MTKLSTTEYGLLIGKTRQDVLYMIKTNAEMPGVLDKEQVGKRWILVVDKKNLKKTAKIFSTLVD